MSDYTIKINGSIYDLVLSEGTDVSLKIEIFNVLDFEELKSKCITNKNDILVMSGTEVIKTYVNFFKMTSITYKDEVFTILFTKEKEDASEGLDIALGIPLGIPSATVDDAIVFRNTIDELLDKIDDELAIEFKPLYYTWNAEYIEYKLGERVLYQDTLYKCITAHKPQEGWKPTTAPSLWVKVLIPDATVIPNWEQPSANNAYKVGDKVKHNGKVWESLHSANVWEPSASLPSLWKEVK